MGRVVAPPAPHRTCGGRARAERGASVIRRCGRLLFPASAMAADASLMTLMAALATFPALRWRRSSMPGGRRFPLGEGVKSG